MNKLLVSAALAATALAPSAAVAQAMPAAVIAVVDLEKVSSQCNACKTASAALRSQQTALENRRKALATPLETEGKAIQAAIDALKGANPDAALQARIRAFQQKEQSGNQELSRQAQQIQRNQQYISQQVQSKLNPIYTQVMQRRGANVLLEVGATLATAASIDVTNDVLAALNTALPTGATIGPLDIKRVMAALPHRYPMLLVDRVESLDPEKGIVAIKAVSMNEEFFQGHFPGRPIMPGVLQVEALAQAAGVLAVESLGLAGSGKLVYFMSIDGVKFRKPVEPGVLLRLEVEFLQKRSRVCKFAGRAMLDGEIATECEFTAMIADPPA